MNKAKELVKRAAALTESGHKLDERTYRAKAKMFDEIAKAQEEYGNTAPSILKRIQGTENAKFASELARNRFTYAANKHKEGKNAINPFAGYTDKSYYESLEKNKDS